MILSNIECYYWPVSGRIFMNKAKLSFFSGEIRTFLYIIGVYKGIRRTAAGLRCIYIETLYLPLLYILLIFSENVHQLIDEHFRKKSTPLYNRIHQSKNKNKTNSRHQPVIKTKT